MARKPLELVTSSTRRASVSKPLVPIWPGYLYQGKLSLCDGPPDSGKTTLLCDIAARVGKGRKMPLSTFSSPPRMVIIAVTEDDIDDTIVPRLKAAGADLDMVRFTDNRLDFDSQEFMDMLLEHRYQGLAPVLMMETITHHLPPNTVFIDEASVRTAMYPLVVALRRTGAVAVGAKHWNKKQGATLVNRGGGSIAFNAIARCVFSCVPQHDESRQLLSVKAGVDKRPYPLVFNLVGNDEDVVCIDWIRREDNHHPELTPMVAQAVEQVEQIFKTLGPVVPSSVMLRALRDGAVSPHTIETVKTFLRIHPQKSSIPNGPWLWAHAPGQNLQILRRKWDLEHANKPEGW